MLWSVENGACGVILDARVSRRPSSRWSFTSVLRGNASPMKFVVDCVNRLLVEFVGEFLFRSSFDRLCS